MIRCLIAFAIFTGTALGQPSIVMSGDNHSIVMSGTAAVPVLAGPSEAELLKLEIEFLKSSLAAATAPPAPPIRKLPPQPLPPVVHPVVKPAAPLVTKPTVERWLVSETWCPHCPAAKTRFLQSGGSADHVLTIAEAKRRHGMTVSSVPFEYTTGVAVASTKVKATVQSRKRLPVVRTRWGTIDLETYNKNCNCSMCQGIRALQQQYRQQYNPTSAPATPPEQDASTVGQEPTPDEVIDQTLTAMDLRSSDVLADFGCGDGRILIAAVRKSGCRGVGVEIDPIKAEEARHSVADAGLSGRIDVHTGDALEFDPSVHGVTAIVAFLYEDLLGKLLPKFQSPGVRVVVTPYHQVPGLAMQRHGDVWIHRVSSIFGIMGTSHESRETLINHLLSDSVHRGRHSASSLRRLSDEQLDALHSQGHGTNSTVRRISATMNESRQRSLTIRL